MRLLLFLILSLLLLGCNEGHSLPPLPTQDLPKPLVGEQRDLVADFIYLRRDRVLFMAENLTEVVVAYEVGDGEAQTVIAKTSETLISMRNDAREYSDSVPTSDQLAAFLSGLEHFAVGAEVASRVSVGRGFTEAELDAIFFSLALGKQVLEQGTVVPTATPIPFPTATAPPTPTMPPTPTRDIRQIRAAHEYFVHLLEIEEATIKAVDTIKLLGANSRPDDPSWVDTMQEQGVMLRSVYRDALVVLPPDQYLEFHTAYLEGLSEFATGGDLIVLSMGPPIDTTYMAEAVVHLNLGIELNEGSLEKLREVGPDQGLLP